MANDDYTERLRLYNLVHPNRPLRRIDAEDLIVLLSLMFDQPLSPEPKKLIRAIEAAARVTLWSWNVDTNALAIDDRAYDLWRIPRSLDVKVEDLSAHIHPADASINSRSPVRSSSGKSTPAHVSSGNPFMTLWRQCWRVTETSRPSWPARPPRAPEPL